MRTPIDVRRQDYVPEEDWPAVSVMLDGFGSPSLPDSPALAGTSMDVRYDDDSSVRYRFESVNELAVHTLGSHGGRLPPSPTARSRFAPRSSASTT